MIAIHSILYIFRPSAKAGEGGLYMYRHYAYAIWLVLPILAASLAFLNSDGAYVSEGTYCYLPIRPFWYRLALSWIPRYMIFILIVVIYASIYFRVRFSFYQFDRECKNDSAFNNVSGLAEGKPKRSRRSKRFSLPPTPVLALHGLIPGSFQSSVSKGDRRSSAPTVSSPSFVMGSMTYSGNIPRKYSEGSPMPSMTTLQNSITASVPSSEFTDTDTVSVVDFGTSSEATTPRNAEQAEPLSPRSAGIAIFNKRFSPRSDNSPRAPSVVNMFAFLHTRPTNMSSEISTPASELELVDSQGENVALSTMINTREKMGRQLRFLFVYPAVYMAMWIVPFINHTMQYNDHTAANQPYVLACLVTILLTLQCTVDCLLFSIREKPWRHIPGTKGQFWESFRFWTSFSQERRGSRDGGKGPGMGRQEMVVEARRAYKRRDEEIAARASEVAERRERGATDRSWWDEGFDGAGDWTHGATMCAEMTPVIEEWDPLDARGQMMNADTKAEKSDLLDQENELAVTKTRAVGSQSV
jgi:G protein-coupled receptor GPR1